MYYASFRKTYRDSAQRCAQDMTIDPLPHIRKLHQEFQTIRRYMDKVLFYDRHFNIIPYEFPLLHTDLHAFFSDRSIDVLTAILAHERKHATSWTRSFEWEGQIYSFSIRPHNDNHLLLKQYILDKFLSLGPTPEELIKKMVRYPDFEGKAYMEVLELCRNMIKYLQFMLEHGGQINIRHQFSTVFLKGVADCTNEAGWLSKSKKRKFIELYLYAQGILYGRYLNLLERYSQQVTVC